MSTNPKSAAFACAGPEGLELYGLTKREYFAAQIMAALALESLSFNKAAKDAVIGADELIAALNEGEPEE